MWASSGSIQRAQIPRSSAARASNGRHVTIKSPALDPLSNGQSLDCEMGSRIYFDAANPAFRRARKKSRRTTRNELVAMDFRATRTRSTGFNNEIRFSRYTSRNSLRARFLTTAFPTWRLVTTPNRPGLPGSKTRQLAIRHPHTTLWPASRVRRKSELRRSLAALGNLRLPSGSLMTQGARRASTACAPHDGGWKESPARFLWTCGSENHAGVGAGFLTVDIGVSCVSQCVFSRGSQN